MRHVTSGSGLRRATRLCVAALAAAPLLAMPPADAATFTTIYSFAGGADGHGPYGKLVQDKAGILYGVTITGGTAQQGNIYALDPASGTPTTLYSFSGGADGSIPESGLALDGKGNLYGVAPSGGSTAHCNMGCGTLFKRNIASGKFSVLYTFTGTDDGTQPIGPLTLDGGTLYGTTTYGGTGTDCGTSGCGTLFKFALATRTFSVLRELARSDGAGPEGRLVRGPSGLLYGSTGAGGPNGSGSLFSVDPSNGGFAVIHGFDYHVDGVASDGDPVVSKGLVYGTARVGGPTSADDGTVYSLDLASGTLTTLYSFQGGTDGLFPDWGVVSGPHGLLYGGTTQGGQSGAGTLFQVNPKTRAYAQIHVFSMGDGVGPSGPLLSGKAGALYGVTSGGGRGAGTVFKIVP
jgi:uncharacterized repeat protein (TIGR03803 family)